MGAPARSRRWILVVEDNADDERMATRAFKNIGRPEQMVVARDGEEAFKILMDRDAPAVVLLDLKLPRVSGLELLMKIRDDHRIGCLPVVILTSSRERTDTGA